MGRGTFTFSVQALDRLGGVVRERDRGCPCSCGMKTASTSGALHVIGGDDACGAHGREDQVADVGGELPRVVAALQQRGLVLLGVGRAPALSSTFFCSALRCVERGLDVGERRQEAGAIDRALAGAAAHERRATRP